MGRRRKLSYSGCAGIVGIFIVISLIISFITRIMDFISENPKILFFPAGVVVLFFSYFFIKFVNNEITDSYTAKTFAAIKSGEAERLYSVLQRVGKRKNVYVLTYYSFIEEFFSDNDVTTQTNNILCRYKRYVPIDNIEADNKRFFLNLLQNSYFKNTFTHFESNHILNLCDFLNVSQELKKEVQIEVEILSKVFAIRKNGLTPIETYNAAIDISNCYFQGNIEILRDRVKDGIVYFEKDKYGKMYISDNGIDIISNGHKNIKIKDVMRCEIINDILRISIVNRQKPLGFYSREQKLILEILKYLKK